MRYYDLTFSAVELDHLYSLLTQEKERGDYFGRRDQYLKRQTSLMTRITDAIRAREDVDCLEPTDYLNVNGE